MRCTTVFAACLLVTASAAVVKYERFDNLAAQPHIDTSAHFLKKGDHDVFWSAGGSRFLSGVLDVFLESQFWTELLLVFSCFRCLFAKWYCFERKKRPLWVFCLDLGKIFFGAIYIQKLNIIQHNFFASQNPSLNNQAAWYLVDSFCDCYISTILCYLVVKHCVGPAMRRRYSIEFGVYNSEHEHGTPKSIDWMSWMWQILIWCAVITFTRMLIAVGVWQVQGALYALAMRVLSPAHGSAKWQLVIAIEVAPLIGNYFQVLVQDSFLKASVKPSPIEDGVEAQLKPLRVLEKQSLAQGY